MTLDAGAQIATTNGAKYAQQLCKHRAHRTETRYEDGRAKLSFRARRYVPSDPRHPGKVISAAGQEAVERYKSVVQSHLDRFAFREVPFEYVWQ